MVILKNQEQIDGIRRSCKLAASCLIFIEPHVKVGANTDHLNELIKQYIQEHDAIAAPLNYTYSTSVPPFPKETCISVNEVICHGIPNKNKILMDGDILNIDVTTILDGYYGDTSKMYSVGKISGEAKRLLFVTKHALNVGISTVWPGNNTGDIGYAISEYARQMGYSVVHQFCGHGVGLKFHEAPQIPHIVKNKFEGVSLKSGMIFTIEPMINVGKAEAVIGSDKWTATTVDGKLSAQYEHTILVTDTGYEILTEV